ncbi:MarR family transcriptional regulator [Pasteurellaceae bacterium LIM206]|nr:MarR family transcriptional regulator [Pasteurellaceae bacterium LIM206]
MTTTDLTELPREFPPLEDFLCFSVYSANLAFGRVYKQYLRPYDLTYTQWIVLLALAETDNQTVNQLGRKVFLASNTLTPLLKQLEKQGLVERNRSSKDERQVIVHLTEKGKEIKEQSKSCMAIFKHCGLTLPELQLLQKAISKLRDNLLESVESEKTTNGNKD